LAGTVPHLFVLLYLTLIVEGGCSYPGDFCADTHPQRAESKNINLTAGFSSRWSKCKSEKACRTKDFEEYDKEQFVYDALWRAEKKSVGSNVMDYGTDDCLAEFTDCQRERMMAFWSLRSAS
jgi:hypothetical protein